MGELVKFAVIIGAIGVQLAAAQHSESWLIWMLYAAAALAAAYLYEPSPLRRAGSTGRDETPDRPAQPALQLLRAQMLLVAVGAASLVTEWSSKGIFPGPTLAVWFGIFASLTVAAWGLRVSPWRRGIEPSQPYDRYLLLALLTVALLLRTLWIDELPRVYFGDESRAGMWVRNSFQAGLPNLFTMGWNTWSMIGLSLQGMFGPWLGLNTVSVRLASALFGTVAVFATYLLARELLDRRLAFLAAALLACNRTAIDFSRLGTTHAQVMVFETFAFFALWRAINTGSAVAYVWTGILAGLCLHTYNAAHAVPALLLGWLALAVIARPRSLRAYAAGAAIALTSFVLVTLPWSYYLTDHYQFAHNWLEFTWMARARQVTPDLIAAFHDGGLPAAWPLFASQLWKTWLGFTVLPANAYQLGYRGGGMLDHVSAALFVLGLAMALRTRARGIFLLYWSGATAFAGGVLTIDPPAFVRLVGLIPAVCILAALPLRSLLANTGPGSVEPEGSEGAQQRASIEDRAVGAQGYAPSRQRRLGLVCAIFLVLAAFADNWRTYFIAYANSSAEETSELVHFIRKLPAASPVYVLGAESFLHFTHDVNVEQFVFDFPDRNLQDVVEPGHFLPIRKPQAEVPTYLVLGPSQLGIEGYVRRLYPHTEGADVRHKANHRLFFRYLQLTPEDLEQQATIPLEYGLSATYERDQHVLTKRVDPQLNVFTDEVFFEHPSRLSVHAPFHVAWRGDLRIDDPGVYSFEVIAGGPFTVDLAGEHACSFDSVSPEEPRTCTFKRNLGTGTVPVAAQWDAWRTESSARLLFQMYWQPPNGQRELIPPDHFVPPPAGDD